MVLSQDIDGGTIVEKNTVLGITVSGGMEQVLVPEVTGLTREAGRINSGGTGICG